MNHDSLSVGVSELFLDVSETLRQLSAISKFYGAVKYSAKYMMLFTHMSTFKTRRRKIITFTIVQPFKSKVKRLIIKNLISKMFRCGPC